MSHANTYEILPKLLKGVAGALLAILVLWVIAGLAGWRERAATQPGTERARALARYEIKAGLDAEATKLHELAWMDQEKGTVHLPIAKAMQLTIAELAQQEVRPTDVAVVWVGPQMPDYNAPVAEPGAAVAPAAAAGAAVAGPGAAPAAAAAAIPETIPPIVPVEAPAASPVAPATNASQSPAAGAGTVGSPELETPVVPAPLPEPTTTDPVLPGDPGATPAGSTDTGPNRAQNNQQRPPAEGTAPVRDSTTDVNPTPAGTQTRGSSDPGQMGEGADYNSQGNDRPVPGVQPPAAENAEQQQDEVKPAPGSDVLPPTAD